MHRALGFSELTLNRILPASLQELQLPVRPGRTTSAPGQIGLGVAWPFGASQVWLAGSLVL